MTTAKAPPRRPGQGGIRQRSEGSFEIKWEAVSDDGRRRTRTQTIRGSRKMPSGRCEHG